MKMRSVISRFTTAFALCLLSAGMVLAAPGPLDGKVFVGEADRKSTRLNSSHG